MGFTLKHWCHQNLKMPVQINDGLIENTEVIAVHARLKTRTIVQLTSVSVQVNSVCLSSIACCKEDRNNTSIEVMKVFTAEGLEQANRDALSSHSSLEWDENDITLASSPANDGDSINTDDEIFTSAVIDELFK